MSTWTRRTTPTSDNFGQAVGYGNGVFIATSYSGTIIRSADNGATWTQVAAFEGKNFNAVVYGDGVWLAATFANPPEFYRSTDEGLTWALVDSPPAIGGIAGMAFKPAGHVFLAVGGSVGPNNYAISTDGGVTWTLPGLLTTANWEAALWDGAQFVACSVSMAAQQTICTSADGQSWAVTEIGVNDYYLGFDGDSYVIAGYNDLIRHATTPAGLADATDISTGISIDDGVDALAGGANVMLLTDYAQALVVSLDHGATWALQDAQFDSGKNVNGFAFGATVIVAVGDSGNISTTPIPSGGGRTGELSITLDDVHVRARGQSRFRRLIRELHRCRVTGTPYSRLITALLRFRPSNR